MRFLWWIIVGLIAGWATGKIMRSSGQGLIGDTVIGIVGAILGGWIMRGLGFQGHGGTLYTILIAIGGAIILTWLYRLVVGRKRLDTTSRSASRSESRSDRDSGNWPKAA